MWLGALAADAGETTDFLPTDAANSSPDVWANIVVPAPDYTPPPVTIPDVSAPAFDTALNSYTAQNNTSGNLFGGNFDLSKFVTGLASLYVTYKVGTQPAKTPTPGQVTRLPDGSLMRTNPDGSTTIQQPNGALRTVMPNGQIVTGTAAAMSALSSVSPWVLIGGVALVGLLVLKKSKG